VTQYIDLFGPTPKPPAPPAVGDYVPMLREAAVARQRAIERVDRNADEDWKRRAAEVIERVCYERETFTADDLWDYLDRPRTPSAVGPALLRAAREGLCVPTETYRRTRYKQRHHDVRVWQSRVAE
jgi:hypothetical protein